MRRNWSSGGSDDVVDGREHGDLLWEAGSGCSWSGTSSRFPLGPGVANDEEVILREAKVEWAAKDKPCARRHQDDWHVNVVILFRQVTIAPLQLPTLVH